MYKGVGEILPKLIINQNLTHAEGQTYCFDGWSDKSD